MVRNGWEWFVMIVMFIVVIVIASVTSLMVV